MDKNIDEFKLSLLTNQYKLRETRQHKKNKTQPTGLLILVNGMEQSGKGNAVNNLRNWLDPRLLRVEANVGRVHDEYEPIWQPHARHLPRHGNIGIFFGNWYADLVVTTLKMMNNSKSLKAGDLLDDQSPQETHQTHNWEDYLKTQLKILSDFEQDLENNNTVCLKCWFEVDENTLIERLNDRIDDPTHLYNMDWYNKKSVAQFNKVAKQIITDQKDWIIIDANNVKKANLKFAEHTLTAIKNALNKSKQTQPNEPDDHFQWSDIPDKLKDIDDPDMDKSEYQQLLSQKQQQLVKLMRKRGKRRIVFAFEGMDAAGKGGSIKRVVAPLDPREYRIFNIAVPMQHELEHPYLWRFWTRLPVEDERYGNRVIVFDRSWYGRVLVERIEGFATQEEWQRAYYEINRFEKDLHDAGTIVIKYWLAIDKKEQLGRFEERQETPHKQFKLTDEDWRNRDKWKDYVQAASDMLTRTSTDYAPWYMVATNDKRTARLLVLDHAINTLTKELLD